MIIISAEFILDAAFGLALTPCSRRELVGCLCWSRESPSMHALTWDHCWKWENITSVLSRRHNSTSGVRSSLYSWVVLVFIPSPIYFVGKMCLGCLGVWVDRFDRSRRRFLCLRGNTGFGFGSARRHTIGCKDKEEAHAILSFHQNQQLYRENTKLLVPCLGEL